jgi:hypothetical protein
MNLNQPALRPKPFGLYAPVIIGPALQYFFENAIIPVYSGNTLINLMDYFPTLKRGYALKQTILLLLYSYMHVHHLQDLNNPSFMIPDDLFIRAFDSDIPAYYYVSLDPDTGSKARFQMQDAIDNYYIPSPMNTFQVIFSYLPQFNPDKFLTSRLLDMRDFNITSMSKIHVDSDLIEVLIDEYAIAEDLEKIFLIFLEPLKKAIREQKRGRPVNPEDLIVEDLTATDIMKISVSHNKIDLLNRLLADDRSNKLIYFILIDDPEMVEEYIDKVDPRDNDAYQVALDTGDEIISDRILSAIDEKNLTEIQVFTSVFPPLLAPELRGGNIESLLYAYTTALRKRT